MFPSLSLLQMSPKPRERARPAFMPLTRQMKLRCLIDKSPFAHRRVRTTLRMEASATQAIENVNGFTSMSGSGQRNRGKQRATTSSDPGN